MNSRGGFPQNGGLHSPPLPAITHQKQGGQKGGGKSLDGMGRSTTSGASRRRKRGNEGSNPPANPFNKGAMNKSFGK